MSAVPTERKSIEESVGQALSSGILTGGMLRKVVALGIVSISEPFADAVFRLKYGNDAKSYKQVERALCKLARRLNSRKNWRMRRSRLDAIAKAVLDYWLADPCPACEGRGWEKPAGAPYLSDNPCMACLGKPGKRPYPWLLDKPVIKIKDKDRHARKRELMKRRAMYEALMDRHVALLCELEQCERHIGEKIIIALSQDVKRFSRLVQEAEEGR